MRSWIEQMLPLSLRKTKFMLRVLCFGRFFDHIPGGMQTHVEHLFRALKADIDFVHLVPSRDSHSSQALVQGFPLYRTASWNVDGSLAISPQLISAARRLHHEKPFDLIHLHFPDPMSHLASMCLPTSIPRAITWHADIIRQKTLLALYRPWLRSALEQANCILVPTPAHISSSAELSTLSDKSRIRIVPFGFDLERFAHNHAQTAAIQRNFPGKIIFALGRHVHYKGFDVLIKAMDALPDDTQLLIGGTGPLTQDWQQLAQQSRASARIHFAGMIDDETLPAYYQACDVFCLPAVNQAEAFGIVQVEAMACAKPVVSTKLNNGVDFVNQDGTSGYTVTPSDVGALAQALNKLLQDDALRARLGQQALQRAVQEFSLASLREKTLKVYQEAAQR
jgi:glycosyltransferase involved in cell wall biosynthesis